MKKIILSLVVVTASLVSCDSAVNVQTSDNISDDMLIVHRVVTGVYGKYDGYIEMHIRDKNGEEIHIDARCRDIGDIKYVQPGDTVYFRRTTNNPEILRIGFKD